MSTCQRRQTMERVLHRRRQAVLADRSSLPVFVNIGLDGKMMSHLSFKIAVLNDVGKPGGTAHRSAVCKACEAEHDAALSTCHLLLWQWPVQDCRGIMHYDSSQERNSSKCKPLSSCDPYTLLYMWACNCILPANNLMHYIRYVSMCVVPSNSPLPQVLTYNYFPPLRWHC